MKTASLNSTPFPVGVRLIHPISEYTKAAPTMADSRKFDDVIIDSTRCATREFKHVIQVLWLLGRGIVPKTTPPQALLKSFHGVLADQYWMGRNVA
jgi:hypothetical protein